MYRSSNNRLRSSHFETNTSPTIIVFGSFVVGLDEELFNPSCKIASPNIVCTEEFGKETVRPLLGAIVKTAQEMAIGNNVTFKVRTYRSSGHMQGTGRWGKITPKDIQEKGISVEFAGPTKRNRSFHMVPKMKPNFVTNVGLKHSVSMYDLDGSIDAMADVTSMPLSDCSVGSIHISCLPSGNNIGGLASGAPLRKAAILEASRVIVPEGYLVWDGGIKSDHDTIIDQNFSPVALKFNFSISGNGNGLYDQPEFDVSGVYQKQGS